MKLLRSARILAHSTAAPARRAAAFLSRGQWLAVAVLALSGVAAFGIAPDSTRDIPPETFVRELSLPALPPVDESAQAGYWLEERVQRGDTVGSVLARMGVEDNAALTFLRTDPAARGLYQLRPGKPLRVETDGDGRLMELRFVGADGDLLTIARNGERFTASAGAAPVEIQWKMAAGEIRSSLYGAADAADLPDAVTQQLTDIFGADIDFYHDLRRGDRFSVVYEVRYLEGEPVATGRIVAAEFVNRGQTYRAFLWRGSDGSESYYAQDGSALRKAFLRSPMEFSRITSGFSLARFHPILQTWRAHKGVDYAAPTGTPVRATASGRVLFAGTQNGYGNVIHLQHQGVFSTLYAHLSRFATGLHTGGRVSQGDVIGYVGQTGWATGPHLHYEFRVQDVQRDPLTVAMPHGEPLEGAQRAQFVKAIAPAISQLAMAQSLPAALVAAGD